MATVTTFRYPPNLSTNPSVGTNGAVAPVFSTEVGGIGPDTFLHPISVDNSGNVNTNVVSSALPAGAATAANQTLEITQLAGIHSDTTSLNSKDYATSAKQDTGNASLASIDSKLTSPLAVTGPLTDTQLRASAVPVSAASLPLPSGAATSANQATEIASLASIDTKLSSQATAANQATEIASLASIDTNVQDIDLATNATANSVNSIDSKTIVVDTSNVTISAPLPAGTNVIGHVIVDSAPTTAVTGPLTDAQLRASPVPISGSITATNSANGATGAAVPTDATQVAGSDGTNLRALKVSATGVVSVDGSAATQPVSGTFFQATQPVSLTSTTITGSVAVTGPLTDTQLRATAVPVSLTSTTVTGTVAVTQSTSPWVTSETTVSTSSVTSVASSASSVSLLASTAGRKNATFYNDSTAILYLKLGTTASTSSYTVQLVAGAYYELPLGKIYTGAIDGIWASANGNVRITELT